MLLTPDGGFNRGSVVGKRVPGTWSRVLDVLVLWTCCVDNVNLQDTRVGPRAGTPLPRHVLVNEGLNENRYALFSIGAERSRVRESARLGRVGVLQMIESHKVTSFIADRTGAHVSSHSLTLVFKRERQRATQLRCSSLGGDGRHRSDPRGKNSDVLRVPSVGS